MKKSIKIITIILLIQCIIVIKVYCLDKLKQFTDGVSDKIDKAKEAKDKYKGKYDSAKDKVEEIKGKIKEGEEKLSTAKEKINDGYNKIFSNDDDTTGQDTNDDNDDADTNLINNAEYVQWLKRMGELSPEKYKKLLATLIKYKKENDNLHKIINNIYNDKTFILLTNVTIDTK